MNETITIRGTLLSDGTLRLPGPVALPAGEVEVVVRSVAPSPVKESLLEMLDRFHAEQEAEGYVPRTAEEIDADIAAMREEWEERYHEIEALQIACEKERNPKPERK